MTLERDLKAMTGSGAFMASATFFLFALALSSSAHPPAWVSRARDTGEQRLRAQLFEILNMLAFTHAVALLHFVSWAQRLRPAFAERGLAAVRMLFVLVVAFHAALLAVAGSDSWGETAAAFPVVVASAAVAWLYVRPRCAQGGGHQDW